MVDNINYVVVWYNVLTAAMFLGDSYLWNAKEWYTENYDIWFVLDIFPKINISECQVQEAKCWLPSYCIRIKILALQLCVKHSKTWENRGTIEPFYGVECQNHLFKESILRSLYD